ncbi:uncharacterized protein [Watersipora subatra]|uniref:uncharacterized protein n=1 Tax=Watersipora subatra TaxID=2589382 RepID=UPI00355AFDED
METPIALLLTLSMASRPHNRNPNSPPHLKGHIFLFGNGTVPVARGDNPFANNALDGRQFLTHHMGFSKGEIERQRQLAVDYWLTKFKVDGEALEATANASIIEYQINPAVNERAYLVTEDCEIPAEGLLVLDGGFQLLITNPDGVPGFDPHTGHNVIFPYYTNLVFAWLRIEGCLEDDIVLPYKSSSLAEFTLRSIIFELDIGAHEYNPYGEGKLLGTSAPIVNGSTITNRLLNYITFEL